MANLDFAKVTGRIGLDVGDSTLDPDDDPDLIWCDAGRVLIQAKQFEEKVPGGTPVPFIMGGGLYEAQISSADENAPNYYAGGAGYLIHNGKPFINVVDLTSEKVNPRFDAPDVATHTVIFAEVAATLPDGTIVRVDFKPRDVRLTKDGKDGTGVNDLALVSPVVPGAATPIIQGPQGIGVQAATINDAGELVLELTNETQENAGEIPVTAEALGAAATATEAADTATEAATTATTKAGEASGAATSAGTAKTAAETAKADAEAAKTAAESARDNLLAQKGTAGGLAELDGAGKLPETQLPERLTPEQLSASYAPKTGSPNYARAGAARPTVGSAFGAKMDAGVGNLVMAVMGDSTGNDTDEWVRKLADRIAARYPERRIDYTLWNGTAYPAVTTIQAGTDYVAPTTSPVNDPMTRTGELIGSTPTTTGLPWGGPAGGLGSWTLDGSKAVRSSVAGEAVVTNKIGPGDVTLTYTGINLSTVATASARETNFYIRSGADGNIARDALRLKMEVQPTTGAVNWYWIKMVNGAFDSTLNSNSTIITANNASVTFNLTLSIVGKVLTATHNVGAGQSLSVTLSDADAEDYANNPYFGFTASASFAGMSIDSIQATTAAPAGVGPRLTIYNGSVAGTMLDYQTARLSAMVPVRPDVTVISSSHNYQTTGPNAYAGIVANFVTALRGIWSAAPVIVSSQNPEFVEGSNTAPYVNAHNARQAGLRNAAVTNGWGYLPVFEAFRSQPDRGLSLVYPDGIHPLPAGSDLWTDVAANYFLGGLTYRT